MRMIDVVVDVSARSGVAIGDILGKSRNARIVGARHAAIWTIRRKLNKSYPQIGRLFKKDHTSIMHACQKVTERLRNMVDEMTEDEIHEAMGAMLYPAVQEKEVKKMTDRELQLELDKAWARIAELEAKAEKGK